MTVDLHVVGVPAPQGSKTAIVRNGRAVLIEGGSATGRKKHRKWRKAVRRAADAAGRPPWGKDTPLAVTVTFVMPLPKSSPKRAGRSHWVKPDLDKLVRSTLDGLADGGLLPGDDQRVTSLEAHKVYEDDDTTPGAWITVEVAA